MSTPRTTIPWQVLRLTKMTDESHLRNNEVGSDTHYKKLMPQIDNECPVDWVSQPLNGYSNIIFQTPSRYHYDRKAQASPLEADEFVFFSNLKRNSQPEKKFSSIFPIEWSTSRCKGFVTLQPCCPKSWDKQKVRVHCLLFRHSERQQPIETVIAFDNYFYTDSHAI